MIEHFIWNSNLIHNGLQLLLFNATSSSVNTDYIDIVTNSRAVLWSSIALAMFIVLGAALLAPERRYWRENLLDRYAWFWVTAASLAFTSVWVMVTQRSRASYILRSVS